MKWNSNSGWRTILKILKLNLSFIVYFFSFVGILENSRVLKRLKGIANLPDQQEQRWGMFLAWNSTRHQSFYIHSDWTWGTPQNQSWFHHTWGPQNSQWHIHIYPSMILEKWFSNCSSPQQTSPHKTHKAKSTHTIKNFALPSLSCAELFHFNRERSQSTKKKKKIKKREILFY